MVCGDERRDVGLAEVRAPLVGAELAGEEVHQRGLARAVGSDEASHRAGRHVERRVVDGLQPGEAARQALDVERDRLAHGDRPGHLALWAEAREDAAETRQAKLAPAEKTFGPQPDDEEDRDAERDRGEAEHRRHLIAADGEAALELAHGILQDRHHHHADDRARDSRHAADDQHRHHREHQAEVERVRRERAQHVPVERARDRSQCARHRPPDEPRPLRVDAERLGGGGVVADCAQLQPPAALPEKSRQDGERDRGPERDPERRHPRNAVEGLAAAGDLARADQNAVDDDEKAERRDGRRRTVQARDRQPAREGNHNPDRQHRDEREGEGAVRARRGRPAASEPPSSGASPASSGARRCRRRSP